MGDRNGASGRCDIVAALRGRVGLAARTKGDDAAREAGDLHVDVQVPLVLLLLDPRRDQGLVPVDAPGVRVGAQVTGAVARVGALGDVHGFVHRAHVQGEERVLLCRDGRRDRCAVRQALAHGVLEEVLSHGDRVRRIRGDTQDAEEHVLANLVDLGERDVNPVGATFDEGLRLAESGDPRVVIIFVIRARTIRACNRAVHVTVQLVVAERVLSGQLVLACVELHAAVGERELYRDAVRSRAELDLVVVEVVERHNGVAAVFGICDADGAAVSVRGRGRLEQVRLDTVAVDLGFDRVLVVDLLVADGVRIGALNRREQQALGRDGRRAGAAGPGFARTSFPRPLPHLAT